MKKASFSIATVALILCAGLILGLFTPDIAHAASALTSLPNLHDVSWSSHLVHAAPGLVALRAKLTDLTAKAEAKRAEIKDDTEADAVRAIEEAHASILSEIEATRAEIVTAEAEEAEAARTAQQRKTRNQAGAGQQADIDAAREAGRAAAIEERRRVEGIREACRRSGAPEDVVQRYISEDTSLQAVRDAEWDRMAERSNAQRIFAQASGDRQDEGETRRRGMRDAIAVRLAHAGGNRSVAMPDHARQFAGMQLVEIAAECVGYRGHMRTAHQSWQVFEQAFRQRGMHTTSDFPAIFTDAMNVRLLQRYEATAPTYRLFSQRATAADFRANNAIRAGDFPALQPVNEAGEIKGGTFSESKEQYQVKPYGVRFNISRQMMINDQLGAIDQMLGSSGVRVADWENGIAFGVLNLGAGLGPVLLTDNKTVFHSNHGNVAGSGGAITVATIGAGRAAMAKQTTLDGIKANFQPSIILCGPDVITSAEQLLATLTPAKQDDAVPASMKRIAPVSDPNLDGNAWYLFADPLVAPCFLFAYLDGFEGPRLTSEDIFGVQGMQVKLEHDFGFAGIDYRGGYRNAGAA
ncbi:hypothetical protein [Mesorhizobium captivum]|uniref:phage major capsid protein n=1 Tax=Mesorhizobium captivum TaxID=3072319 RepID=UPI002A243074|nr:hypothetical protein [Mesorhizobium sp. VK23E]MDX8513538.1 hypothetical protein [Mesorhizobium sp. VK23E]